MTSIGAEVGQKMRSAIKAKLLELNCYVDDELPDYIMVMVANKRSKSQMKEDLQLFLSSKTSTFVDWLHIVLKKLKEVTVTNPEVYKKAVKRPVETTSSNINVKKEKKDKKIKMEKSEADFKSLTDDLPIDANKLSQQRKIVVLEEKRISNSAVEDEFDIPPLSEVNMSTEEELEEMEKKIQSVKNRLGLQVESEEEDAEKLKEELLKSRSIAKAKKTAEEAEPKSLTPPKRTRITFEEEPAKKKSIQERLGKRSWRTEKESSREVKKRRRSSTDTSKTPVKTVMSPPSRRKESILHRLGVKSKVSVPQKAPEVPEEPLPEREVASVVKVKPRVIPEDVKVANKNLLLKAVAEAQKSVTQTPKVGAHKAEALYTKNYQEKKMKLRSNQEVSPYVPAPLNKIPDQGEELELSYVPSEKPPEESDNFKQKFIVTLRGIDSPNKKSIKDRLDKRRSPSPIVFQKSESVPSSAPPKSVPVQPVVPTKNKERCKYWPVCSRGAKCEYLHPNQNCEKFPNCVFGSKCLFVHPACKFGTSCTRKDCMYSHGSQQQVCKYHPKCANIACPFYHPKFATKFTKNMTWRASK